MSGITVKYHSGGGYIETYPSGTEFNPADDHPDFRIEDIAWATGMCVRYNGHVKQFYSIAEHCVLVSNIMEDAANAAHQDPLHKAYEGLMHDALEAYLSDVPAPFKQFLPDYQAFDANLETKLRAHYDVGPKTEECKYADWIALFIEANQLVKSGGRKFADPLNLRNEALLMAPRYDIFCWSPGEAAKQFLDRYEVIKDVA